MLICLQHKLWSMITCEVTMDDDVLVTKWLLLGGVLWHSGVSDNYWFAIEPGGNEYDGRNGNGTTPASAVRVFMKYFPEEEICRALRQSSDTTSSARGHTSPPTE